MQLLNSFWIIFKLFYLHAAYMCGGLDQEYFYLVRAQYFADLKWYNFAIGNYKKALKESNDPSIKAALGWCYFQLGRNEVALEFYRDAHKNSKQPDIALGLAYAEYHCGNIDRCKHIVAALSDSVISLEPSHKEDLARLEDMLATVS